MAKTRGEPTNYRVVVEPKVYGYERRTLNVEALRLRCEDLVRAIKRHVDDIGSITVECDVEDVCEHCGAAWTEDGSAYNGGCCSEDGAANPESSDVSHRF